MHFVDTNVLVYCFDDSDPTKRDRAQLVMRRLWETRTGRLSHQVLHEFYTTVTRKLKPTLPRPQARTETKDLLGWSPVSSSHAILDQAWQIEERYGLSWWDSLIVAAAIAQNCTILLTDDLQHGLEIGRLRVVNPFHSDFDIASLGT